MAKIDKTNTKSILNARVGAAKQGVARLEASDRRKSKAGLVNTPSNIMIKKDKSGKTTATKYGKKFSGPISGSAIAKAKKKDK